MKVVVDTNVLVSAALKDKDPETVIRWIAAHPDCEWLVTKAILEEYNGVLARPKFGLPVDLLAQWGALLDESTTLLVSDKSVDFPRDPGDEKFIACAVTADADFLVTGDRDFTAARKLMNTRIVSVALFKRLVCDAIS